MRNFFTPLPYAYCLLLFFILSNGHAQDYPLVVPCPDDLLGKAQDAIEELDDAASEAAQLMRDQDFAAQNLAARWLGARNQDDVEDAAKVLLAARGLAESVAFLCLPLTDYRSGPDGPAETIAFVYQSIPVIHLYGNFSDLPETGEFSMVGTLLHELAHLHFVAGANLFQDETYDAGAALALAEADPDAARTLRAPIFTSLPVR